MPEPPEKLTKLIVKAFEKGGITLTGKGEEPNSTSILMFIPEPAIDAMAVAVESEYQKKKPDADALAAALAEILAERGAAPDIALSGRMTEFDAKGPFEKLNFTVEAASQVAHAISTHEVINEVDYFTAVDDLEDGARAGHVAEAMFNSACFYKYFAIDWDRLVENLGGNKKLAAATLGHFLHAAATTAPSGKQNSFAAHNPPDGILVEVKKTKTPTSYANAFADPVRGNGERGLVAQSVAQLGQYVSDIAAGYGGDAVRFWFSPNGRYPLSWIDPADRGADAEKPVIESAEHNVGALDDLVERIVESACDVAWSDVRTAGAKA